MELIESQLHLITKKKKLQLTRTILNSRSREFLSYDAKTNKLIVKFSLNKCDRFTRYADGSWEFNLNEMNNKKTFRFVHDEPNENFKWINLINKVLSNQINDDETQLDQDETLSNSSNDLSNEIYNVQIDSNLTDDKYFTSLNLNATYLFTIDESGYSLQSKNNGEMHAFETKTIKKYGSTKYCFAFELGSNSEYGSGRIALISSKKQDAQLIYEHFHDLSNRKFMQLAQKQKEISKNDLNLNKIPPKVIAEVSEVDQSITRENVLNEKQAFITNKLPLSEPIYSNHKLTSSKPNIVDIYSNGQKNLLTSMNPNDNKENILYQNETNDLVQKIEANHKNYNAYEIKIEVEPRSIEYNHNEKIIRNNNVALVLTKSFDSDADSLVTETDEEFYKEIYRPQYISNKSLKAFDNDYFKDNANNAIYTKVKII